MASISKLSHPAQQTAWVAGSAASFTLRNARRPAALSIPGPMADVGYIFLMVLFTVLAALFVIGCDKIIGPDDVAMGDEDRDDPATGAERALR
jgi:hypothetical protein